MKHFVLTLALLTLTITASTLHAQSPNDSVKSTLTGKWRITWLNGGSPNKLQLTDSNGSLTGTFAADGGESCGVTGTATTTTGITTIALAVTCSKFTVQLKGTLKEDTITGTYLAYGNSGGDFKMVKLTCFLPEGCNNQ